MFTRKPITRENAKLEEKLIIMRKYVLHVCLIAAMLATTSLIALRRAHRN